MTSLEFWWVLVFSSHILRCLPPVIYLFWFIYFDDNKSKEKQISTYPKKLKLDYSISREHYRNIWVKIIQKRRHYDINKEIFIPKHWLKFLKKKIWNITSTKQNSKLNPYRNFENARHVLSHFDETTTFTSFPTRHQVKYFFVTMFYIQI